MDTNTWSTTPTDDYSYILVWLSWVEVKKVLCRMFAQVVMCPLSQTIFCAHHFHWLVDIKTTGKQLTSTQSYTLWSSVWTTDRRNPNANSPEDRQIEWSNFNITNIDDQVYRLASRSQVAKYRQQTWWQEWKSKPWTAQRETHWNMLSSVAGARWKWSL